MRSILLAASMMAACTWGYDDPGTFGDGAELISVAFCESTVSCGVRGAEDLNSCIEREYNGLCGDEGRWDCVTEIDSEQSSIFLKCAEDLSTWDCRYFLPASCYKALELR